MPREFTTMHQLKDFITTNDAPCTLTWLGTVYYHRATYLTFMAAARHAGDIRAAHGQARTLIVDRPSGPFSGAYLYATITGD